MSHKKKYDSSIDSPVKYDFIDRIIMDLGKKALTKAAKTAITGVLSGVGLAMFSEKETKDIDDVVKKFCKTKYAEEETEPEEFKNLSEEDIEALGIEIVKILMEQWEKEQPKSEKEKFFNEKHDKGTGRFAPKNGGEGVANKKETKEKPATEKEVKSKAGKLWSGTKKLGKGTAKAAASLVGGTYSRLSSVFGKKGTAIILAAGLAGTLASGVATGGAIAAPLAILAGTTTQLRNYNIRKRKRKESEDVVKKAKELAKKIMDRKLEEDEHEKIGKAAEEIVARLGDNSPETKAFFIDKWIPKVSSLENKIGKQISNRESDKAAQKEIDKKGRLPGFPKEGKTPADERTKDIRREVQGGREERAKRELDKILGKQDARDTLDALNQKNAEWHKTEPKKEPETNPNMSNVPNQPGPPASKAETQGTPSTPREAPSMANVPSLQDVRRKEIMDIVDNVFKPKDGEGPSPQPAKPQPKPSGPGGAGDIYKGQGTKSLPIMKQEDLYKVTRKPGPSVRDRFPGLSDTEIEKKLAVEQEEAMIEAFAPGSKLKGVTPDRPEHSYVRGKLAPEVYPKGPGDKRKYPTTEEAISKIVETFTPAKPTTQPELELEPEKDQAGMTPEQRQLKRERDKRYKEKKKANKLGSFTDINQNPGLKKFSIDDIVKRYSCMPGGANTFVPSMEKKKTRFDDEPDFELWEHIPIFKEHDGKDEGLDLEFNKEMLQKIIDRCNERIETSEDYPVIIDGHTETDDDESREVLGFASNFCMGEFGNPPVGAIYCDFHIKKDKIEKAKGLPRRSIELWHKDMTADPIVLERAPIDKVALLGDTRPALDLGLMFSMEKKEKVLKNSSVSNKYYCSLEKRESPMNPEDLKQILEAVMQLPAMQFISERMQAEQDEAAKAQMAYDEESKEEAHQEEANKEDKSLFDEENKEEKSMFSEDKEKTDEGEAGAVGEPKLRMQYEQSKRRYAKLEAAHKELAKKITEIEQKERIATRKNDLLQLEAEGYNFDISDELDNVKDMDLARYSKHLQMVRKNYRQAPVGFSMIKNVTVPDGVVEDKLTPHEVMVKALKTADEKYGVK